VHTVDSLAQEPNSLAPRYARFRVGERLLFTGHSHQAWPDAGFEGQVEAWNDAAELADGKWERAFARAGRVRAGFAQLLGAAPGEIALAESTHALVVRFLSALPLAERKRLITTDGEFHTLRRQLDRLAESGWLEVVRVPAEPVDSLADRLAAKVDRATAAVLASSVLFETARVVPGLHRLLAACREAGAELLVDAYHHLNVVPFSLAGEGLAAAFVVGGGYKYCQLGEGNCFLRVPPGREAMRPLVTGWFSEFERLSSLADGRVHYGEGPARWAGSTYDPTSHYRAARVFDFFGAEGLTPRLLRQVSQHQVGLLRERFDALDLDPAVIRRDRSVRLEGLGGFLALSSPRAGAISMELRARGVWTDFRGEILRFGPAPYHSDRQIEEAMEALGEVARAAKGP
jgi:kynureninase